VDSVTLGERPSLPQTCLLMLCCYSPSCDSGSGPDCTAVPSSVAVDPILIHESKMPNSAFSSGQFVDLANRSYPTTLHQVGAEAVGTLYRDAFDTVIMMNVVEHVASAFDVLESIVNVTKPGGVVIFWEPSYSAWWEWGGAAGQELLLDMSLPLRLEVQSPEWERIDVRDSIRSRAFDRIAHPIRVDPSVLEFFASFFHHLLYLHSSQKESRRDTTSTTLVGRLKPRRKAQALSA
jgi:SAM-dependent methyltransferase